MRSIRAHLVAWNALTLALLFALLGVILHFSVGAVLLASIDHDLDIRAQRMLYLPPPDDLSPAQLARQKLEPQPRAPKSPPASPVPRPQRPYGAEVFIETAQGAVKLLPRLINIQGQVLRPPGDTKLCDRAAFAAALQGRNSNSTIEMEGQNVRIASRRFPPQGRVQMVIQAPYPLAANERAVQSVDRALLLLLPVALLCAGLGGALSTQRVLQPVRKITQAAERIGTHDLSERLPQNGHDEFAQLSGTFNDLLSRVQSAFDKQRNLIEQQRRFTADAAHELRTPLTVIKANSSLCLNQKTSLPDALQSMQEVDGAASSMTHLVNDLLLLARSDEGQLGRNRTLFSLREVAERAISSTRLQRESAPIDNTIEDALWAEANEEEITRLLTNLLQNAVRYTPPSGKITVRANHTKGWLELWVCDSGMGIAPQHLPHLGERFYRIESSRARYEGGTGLGLSICRGIVAAHGGHIGFQSEEGKGTTVEVRLPLPPHV